MFSRLIFRCRLMPRFMLPRHADMPLLLLMLRHSSACCFSPCVSAQVLAKELIFHTLRHTPVTMLITYDIISPPYFADAA